MMKKVKSNIDVLSGIISFRGKVVVDVGCGTGELVRELTLKGATVTGIDFPEMIQKAHQHERAGDESYRSGKAEQLPFGDECADLITFFASLHHVPEGLMEQALREARRVLRTGGRVACVEPVGEKGSYFELVSLSEDERDIQAMAHCAIKHAGTFNLVNKEEYRIYFERSLKDYYNLIEIFIEDEHQRSQLAEKARDITQRLSREAGIDFQDFRFRSICRVNILTKV